MMESTVSVSCQSFVLELPSGRDLTVFLTCLNVVDLGFSI